jgi:hypothetical protein
MQTADVEPERPLVHQRRRGRPHPARYNFGVLLATLLDPPDLGEARRWYTAAEAGKAEAAEALSRVRSEPDK